MSKGLWTSMDLSSPAILRDILHPLKSLERLEEQEESAVKKGVEMKYSTQNRQTDQLGGCSRRLTVLDT